MGGSKSSEQCEAMWKQNKTFLSLPAPSVEVMEVMFVGLMNDHYNREVPPANGGEKPEISGGQETTTQQQQQPESSQPTAHTRSGSQPHPHQHSEPIYVHAARVTNHPPVLIVDDLDGRGGEESDEGWAPGHEVRAWVPSSMAARY